MTPEQIFHQQLRRHGLKGRIANLGKNNTWLFQDNNGDDSQDSYAHKHLCAVALGAYLQREGFGPHLTDVPPSDSSPFDTQGGDQ